MVVVCHNTVIGITEYLWQTGVARSIFNSMGSNLVIMGHISPKMLL